MLKEGQKGKRDRRRKRLLVLEKYARNGGVALSDLNRVGHEKKG